MKYVLIWSVDRKVTRDLWWCGQNLPIPAWNRVNMISKARWILTKGTSLGQTLFSTLVKWESSLFVTWKCCKEAKKVHIPFCRGAFVGLFFALSLTSYKVWELSLFDQKNESQTYRQKPPFKFCKMSISAVCHMNCCMRMEKEKVTYPFVVESLRVFSSWISSPSD